MSNFKGLYDVRDVKDSDKSFILATFLRGLYYGDSWFNRIPKEIFMDNYKLVAQALVNGDRVIIKIACLKEDPDVILGYSMLSADYQTIHWVYVKSAFRLRGIGRTLLPERPVAVSHLSDLGVTLLNKYPETIFNPFTIA